MATIADLITALSACEQTLEVETACIDLADRRRIVFRLGSLIKKGAPPLRVPTSKNLKRAKNNRTLGY